MNAPDTQPTPEAEAAAPEESAPAAGTRLLRALAAAAAQREADAASEAALEQAGNVIDLLRRSVQ